MDTTKKRGGVQVTHSSPSNTSIDCPSSPPFRPVETTNSSRRVLTPPKIRRSPSSNNNPVVEDINIPIRTVRSRTCSEEASIDDVTESYNIPLPQSPSSTGMKNDIISKPDDDDDDDGKINKKQTTLQRLSLVTKSKLSLSEIRRWFSQIPPPNEWDMKKVLRVLIFITFGALVIDTLWRRNHLTSTGTDGSQREFLTPAKFSEKFLKWVQLHPALGICACLIVIAGAVVSMVPIGTPLTVGCGYIYRGVYGWSMGLFIATAVAMIGSALGAVTCFLLGRYMMRQQVKKWVRKYPLFDAIDVAASEHGLKIMAMLYLTPVLPLGIVSYMCGTTSMSIYSFTLAKVASLPLYLVYTFLGASAHSFLTKQSNVGEAGGSAEMAKLEADFDITKETEKLEENETLIISGIVLSVVMMTLITRHIKKELMRILERQKKHKPGEAEDDSGDDTDENVMEVGLTARHRRAKTEQHVDA